MKQSTKTFGDINRWNSQSFLSNSMPAVDDFTLILNSSSDLSYRLLVRQYGAQVTFTEMNVAEYYQYNQGEKKRKLKSYNYEFSDLDRPLIVQLAGNCPEHIVSLANSEFFHGHIDGIDLNVGCPQSFAMEKKIGAALLRDPDRLVDLAYQCSNNIPYPLSVKMRIHDDGYQTTLKIIEKLHSVAGVQAFTLHGRYWWQKGSNRGLADWEVVKMIRENVSSEIPIIGNGDVIKHVDFESFRKITGVDSVMAGYGALLDPTIFQSDTIPVASVLQEYLNIAIQHRNSLIDVLRHIEWMLKGRSVPITPSIRSKLFACKNLIDVQQLLKNDIKDYSIDVEIPSLSAFGTDQIEYPPSLQDMTPKQRKAFLLRQTKNDLKKSKYTS